MNTDLSPRPEHADEAAPGLTAPELTALLAQALGEAFTAYTTAVQSARDDLYGLSMSSLGGCTRQAAYRLARTPPSEELVFGQMREANIGTMIHLGLLPHMAQYLGGRDEVVVTLRLAGLTIPGRSDLYLPHQRTVGDLKTTGAYKFSVLAGTLNRSHRLQVAGYALAFTQDGREVEWIAWIYLDRSSGAEYVVVERFGEELIELVGQRCEELLVYAEQPDDAPREERGPGLSVICDSCPWLRECWGADAQPGVIGAQRILVHDHAGVEQALRMYDEARTRESTARNDKEFARAMFTGYEPGAYGDFEFSFGGGGLTDDKDVAVLMLSQAGIPIPRKPTAKKLSVKRRHRKP